MNEYYNFIDVLLTSDENPSRYYDTEIPYFKPKLQQIQVGYDIWFLLKTMGYSPILTYAEENTIDIDIYKNNNLFNTSVSTTWICFYCYHKPKLESIFFENMDIHSHTYRLQLEEIIKHINTY